VNDLAAAGGTALWLGILTAISPCPLATNIAAISYIGREVGQPGRVLASGLAYALGRVLAYVLVAALVVVSLLSVPGVAWFLQTRMNQFLGPVLVLMGLVILEWIKIPVPWGGASEKVHRWAVGAGVIGAGFLGLVFALSFCPVSAGLFFGSLIPLSVGAQSRIVLPALYGLGTGLPVVAFAVMIAAGAGSLARAFNVLTWIERRARVATGIVFILVGLYFVATQIFGAALW